MGSTCSLISPAGAHIYMEQGATVIWNRERRVFEIYCPTPQPQAPPPPPPPAPPSQRQPWRPPYVDSTPVARKSKTLKLPISSSWNSWVLDMCTMCVPSVGDSKWSHICARVCVCVLGWMATVTYIYIYILYAGLRSMRLCVQGRWHGEHIVSIFFLKRWIPELTSRQSDRWKMILTWFSDFEVFTSWIAKYWYLQYL